MFAPFHWPLVPGCWHCEARIYWWKNSVVVLATPRNEDWLAFCSDTGCEDSDGAERSNVIRIGERGGRSTLALFAGWWEHRGDHQPCKTYTEYLLAFARGRKCTSAELPPRLVQSKDHRFSRFTAWAELLTLCKPPS